MFDQMCIAVITIYLSYTQTSFEKLTFLIQKSQPHHMLQVSAECVSLFREERMDLDCPE